MCEQNKLSHLSTTLAEFGIVDKDITEQRSQAIQDLFKLLGTPCSDVPDLCNLPFFFKHFTVLGRGLYGVVFQGYIEHSSSRSPYKVAIKITGFKKGSLEGYELLNIANKKRPEWVEWEVQTRLHRALSRLQTIPHVPWPFLNFSCNISDKSFLKVILKQAKFNMKIFYPLYRVSIIEFVPMGDLEHFFDKAVGDKTQDVLYILFQVLMSLAQLQAAYPTFIHNDLHTGNILLKPVSKGTPLKYKLDTKEYEILSLGYIALLNDFDFAEIRPEIVNAKSEEFFGKKSILSNYTDVYRFTGAYFDLLYEDLGIETSASCKKFIAEISLADKKLDFERSKGYKTDKEKRAAKKHPDFKKFSPQLLVSKPIFTSLITNVS